MFDKKERELNKKYVEGKEENGVYFMLDLINELKENRKLEKHLIDSYNTGRIESRFCWEYLDRVSSDFLDFLDEEILKDLLQSRIITPLNKKHKVDITVLKVDFNSLYIYVDLVYNDVNKSFFRRK